MTKWAKRAPIKSPDTEPSPIQVPTRNAGKFFLQTTMDWNIQDRITMMNQGKNISCGKNATSIPILAPIINSLLPPAGSGEKNSIGVRITRKRNGVVRSQLNSLGTPSTK